ncbi:hypothetical protein FQR65_LT09683 [Abscondita terminalis]|nr:hypothetical protein FQR65_LT09683 [Abscondita terminalis]
MNLYKAEIADVLRCSQRDDAFVTSVKENIFSLIKLFGFVDYGQIRKIVPIVANTWYYYFTSLHNLQTLGEEYTGTLRFTTQNKIPSKLIQTCWLVFYVGGESFYDRFLDHLISNLKRSESLTNEARTKLIRVLSFLKEHKLLLFRLHHSFFYIYGTYYNLSNRITGIKYVLLRQWMQDDSSRNSFKILGNLSLVYLIYLLVQKGIYLKPDDKGDSVTGTSSAMVCSLCTDNRKNTACTPCGHLFCWDCIYESLNYQQCCPICREMINPSRIIRLQNYE